MKPAEKKKIVKKLVKAQTENAARLSDLIADFAEEGYQEFKSAGLLADYLRSNDFTIEYPWKYMPTAFKATWGCDKPTIGFLAEYDALPGCGTEPNTPGHGCGHNLLGTASAVGAVVTRQILETQNIKGRIVLWGCPAEELVGGKVFMARDGAFRDNDAILSWHPDRETYVDWAGHSALDSVTFEYFGKTAHGAWADQGRSALDGIMLLDVSVNYLREHIPENVRIHMCICNGGDAPNVVPDYAKSWYYIRGKDRKQVDEIRKRIIACARGAAMATETRVKVTKVTGVYNRLENEHFGKVVIDNLNLFGSPEVSADDIAAIEKLSKKPVFSKTISHSLGQEIRRSSSDEENVSWLAPFGMFRIACVSKEDVALHHRDFTNQIKLPFAHKGVLKAAEVFAGTACDLYTKTELLDRIKAEFKKSTSDFTYDPIISKTLRPNDYKGK